MQNGIGFIHRVSSYLLVGVVILSPIPFGSTDRIAVSTWAILLSIVAIGALPSQFTKAQLVFVACATVVVAAWAATIYVQQTRPIFGGKFDHPIWKQATEYLGVPLEGGVSAARNSTYYAAAPQIACFLALICGFFAGRDRSIALRIIRIASFASVALAAFAILSFAIDPTKVLWREKLGYRSFLTGTFTNRNTAAVYFGSFAVIWLLVLAERVEKFWPRSSRSWFQAVKTTIARSDISILRAAMALLFVLSAMLMTGSRAGVLITFSAMLGGLLIFYRKSLSSFAGLAGSALVGLTAILILLQFMGSFVTNRFDLNNLSDSGRLNAYLSTLTIISHFPWFGTGLGTFALVFPEYRSASISTWGTWDRAHNTLLELASEQGLPFATIVVVSFVLMAAVLVRGVRIRRRDRIVPLSALLVGGMMSIHSLVDFSLQIPAVAIFTFTLIGLGMAQSNPSVVVRPQSTNLD
jgi:O-antigen ligase